VANHKIFIKLQGGKKEHLNLRSQVGATCEYLANKNLRFLNRSFADSKSRIGEGVRVNGNLL